jgi:quercetin dioxygenase-like cupin family protein
MAAITRNPRESRVQEKGARGIKEALLAGPASGCNRFTLRKIVLEPDGCTARTCFNQITVYFIHSGCVTLSHSEGDLDLLSEGNTAVVHKDEVHHLHNTGSTTASIIKVAPQ